MLVFPEGYREFDLWEAAYQFKERKIPVKADVAAIDYMDEQVVLILTFPDFPEVKGLLPEAESGIERSLIKYFTGTLINVLIRGIDREAGLLVCSRQELLRNAEEKLKNVLKEGDIISVKIKAITRRENNSVLVVDAGEGVLTEIPRSEAVIWRTLPLSRQYRIGETVKGKVMSLEPMRISIKAARPDPWSKADYKRGQFIAGTIYRVTNGNVFVEPDLTPGILGLAPVPLLGYVQPGYRVTCKVRYFSAEEKKLHLYLVNRLAGV